jgi:hypothetical protein
MASSNPNQPETQPAIAPRVQMLVSIADQIAAIDELIGLARRSIRVFDGDLSDTGWNRVARAELLAAFLRGSREARLDIIVHDTRYVETHAARLRALQQLFAGSVTIHRTGAHDKGVMDPLVLVDGLHYLHRFHVGQPRATLGIMQPRAIAPFAQRFDELWAGGEPGVSATVLGL